MNRTHKKRLAIVISFLMLISCVSGLILYALKQNINLFYTPTELIVRNVIPDHRVRMGGYVKNNSVIYDSSGQFIIFTVTDRKNDIKVRYQGVLPNLFREGQTVVVTGKWSHSVFLADQVLAKHDEKYRPATLKGFYDT